MRFSPLPVIRRYLRRKLGTEVFSGPYRGMKWQELNGITCFETKLLGIYEKELYPILENLSCLNIQSLTILGSAEGYHAIGLAKILQLKPVCFESDPVASTNLKQLAKLNNVSIEPKGTFNASTEWLPATGLILIDIEGSENDILTPDRLSQWKQHYILVEVHAQTIKETLQERTKSLFTSQFIACQERTIYDYPFVIPLKTVLKRWWRVPVQEWRSDSIGWLWLTPK